MKPPAVFTAEAMGAFLPAIDVDQHETCHLQALLRNRLKRVPQELHINSYVFRKACANLSIIVSIPCFCVRAWFNFSPGPSLFLKECPRICQTLSTNCSVHSPGRHRNRHSVTKPDATPDAISLPFYLRENPGINPDMPNRDSSPDTTTLPA